MKKKLELPRHIISVIISKVTPANLPACRAVCKSWNHLVLDLFGSTSGKFANSFYIGLNSKWEMHAFNIDGKELEGIDKGQASLNLLDTYWDDPKIINACNGLLLCTFRPDKRKPGGRYIVVVNPMTNEYTTVPSRFRYSTYSGYGFGFSPNTNQFKVVQIIDGKVVEALTLDGRNDSRRIDTGKYLIEKTNGVYLDGSLYWLGRSKNMTKYVCRFDVEKETFQGSTIPVLKYYHSDAAIKVCNNNVYVTMVMGYNHFQVWMMQGNTNGGSVWVNKFVGDVGIRVECKIMSSRTWDYPQMVKVFEDGEILFLLHGVHFFCYNPNNGELRAHPHYTLTIPTLLHHIPSSFNFDPLPKILGC